MGLQLAEHVSVRGADQAAEGVEAARGGPLGQLDPEPAQPRPEKRVRFGLQTWDEMMVGFAAYVWESPETAAEMAKNPPSQADLVFDRIDTNGDDVITADEIPERFRPMLAAVGLKAGGKISRDDFVRQFGDLINRFGPKKDGAKKKDDEKPE